MRNIILILLFFPGWVLTGQSFTISGELKDSLSEPLSYATVILLNTSDSSLENFVVSSSSGSFALKNVKPGKYFLRISFVGYRTYFSSIQTPSSGNVLNLGKIQLSVQNNTLNAVTITAEKAPVLVKKDTIEFNASSFKTNPNANVEDLLKKMPGIEVKSDGKIVAQGQEVKRVEVDGRPFFGDDPTLATRNLPANAVDKVQVYDKKSEQATFTGIDDGQKQKTINLKLKADKKKVLFGSLSGGAGTNERFRGKLGLNRFNAGNQLSLLGMAGNINEQGFSMEDYLNFSGAMRQMAGGDIKFRVHLDDHNNVNGVPLNIGNQANGIITSYAGGVNTNHNFGTKTSINASYFLNSIGQDLQTATDRVNFLPGSAFNLQQQDIQSSGNTSQRLNFTIDQKIDSMNTFKFISAFNYARTNLDEKVNATNSAGDSLINNSRRIVSSSGDEKKSNSELLLRHKFKKQGRTLSLDIRTDWDGQDIHGTMNAVNRFYRDSIQTVNQNQRNQLSNNYRNYEGRLSYTDKIGYGKYYEVSYHFGANNSHVDQEVFDLSNASERLDTTLSNKFRSIYLYNNFGLNLRFVKRDYNLVFGGNLQRTDLRGTLEFENTRINKNYLNFLPAVSFNYDFTSTRHLTVEYTTQVEQPSLIQLQPVLNNNDPLNLYVGNPDLRPAYDHTLQVRFNLFSPASFFSLFLLAQADYRMNAISNSQTIDENLVTLTMPVNVKYDKSGFGHMDIILPLKFISSRFNFGADIRTNSGITILNNSATHINSGSFDAKVQYNLNLKDNLDLNLGVEVNKQTSRYGFGQPDQKYLNNDYSADISFHFLKRLLMNMKMNYLLYNNSSSGDRQEIPLLNAYVSYFLFKSRRGELRFSTRNLLNKTIGVSQTISQNYFERDVKNSPGRYFMISFTYDLNKAIDRQPGAHDTFIGIGG